MHMEPLLILKCLPQGRGYKVLPGITSVSTKTGSNAVVEAETNSIGRVEKFEIQNIGFDYSADKSVRPTAKLSQVLKLDKFNSINRIGITSLENIIPSLQTWLLLMV